MKDKKYELVKEDKKKEIEEKLLQFFII